MSKYNFFFCFLYNIKMEPTTSNNSINAINEVRKLFNDVRNNLNHEETIRIRKNSIKRKLSIIF